MDDETLNHSPPSQTARAPTVLSVETNGRPGSTGTLGEKDSESHGGHNGNTGSTGSGSQHSSETSADMGYRTREIQEEERVAHAVMLEMLKQLTAAIKQVERHSDDNKVKPLISELRELHDRSSKEVVDRHRDTWTLIAGESQAVCSKRYHAQPRCALLQKTR
jgi:hypothetical protein